MRQCCFVLEYGGEQECRAGSKCWDQSVITEGKVLAIKWNCKRTSQMNTLIFSK